MACIVLNNGLESSLHKQLIEKYGQELADKKMQGFMSDSFKQKFGNYQELIDNKSDFIPPNFKNRLNDKFEPLLLEDNNGFYYIDKNYQNQYIDVADSELFKLFKSERAINSLVEILAKEHLDNIGVTMNFDTLGIEGKESKILLKDSILNKIEKLSFETANSEDLNISTNGVTLYEILNNNKALKQLEYKVNEFYKAKKFIYAEEFQNEELDDNILGQRDSITAKSSFETNPKAKVGAIVKLRLSLIKDPKNIESDFGQAMSVDYNVLYNKLTHILSDNYITIDKNQDKHVIEDAFTSIINLLKVHAPHISEIANLVDYLSKLDVETNDVESVEGIQLHQLKAGIVRAFNLQKNNFDTKVLHETKVVVEKGLTEQFTRHNGTIGTRNVTNDVIGSEYKYESDDASTLINNKKSFLVNWGLSFKEYFEFPEKVTEVFSKKTSDTLNETIDEIKKIENKKLDATSDIKVTNLSKANEVLDLLKKVGIDIPNEVFNRAMNNNKDNVLTEVKLNENYDDFILKTKNSFINARDNFQNNRELFNNYWFNQLAKAELFYSSQGDESSINQAGKNKYLFSTPSGIRKTIYTWKKNPQLFEDFYNDLGVWEQNSKIFNHLLALDVSENERLSKRIERLSKLDVDIFNNFTNSSTKTIDGKTKTVRESAKDVKELSKNEDIKIFVNDILKSQLGKDSLTKGRGTTAPGKSTQVGLIHDFFLGNNVSYKANGEININNAVDVVYDYFIGELNRINEAHKSINDKSVKGQSKLKAFYHFKNGEEIFDNEGNLLLDNLGNAFKSQLMSDLSYDKIAKSMDNVIYKKYPLYNTNGEVLFENLEYNKPEIHELIKKTLIEKLNELKQDLLEANLFEKVGENSYINKGVDTRIMKKYSDNYKINNESLNRLLGDVLINGLINQIEYSKMFAGDVAYYKNPVDYIKRIGATISDGTYEYITKHNATFNVGVIDSVEFREPYLESFKEIIQDDPNLLRMWEEDVNAADAQAWITPKRWKSLLLGCSMFTPEHQVVYEKLIGKNKEPLTKDELKIVAQPLKGHYFMREEKGEPVFLKYSQAVLIPSLIKSTKLQDLYDFMKHHKVDELVTFDAIKAGSPKSTKLHDELGGLNVRDESGKMKSLNVLKLDSRGWKLQQDLPTKTYKETDTGSQLLNNMLVLLAHMIHNNVKQFEHNGQQYSALEYAKLIDNTLGDLLGIGLNDFFNEFSIDKDSKEIKDSSKLYNILADELNSREYSDEVIKALRAKLSIVALPGFDAKLQSIFSSIVKDRTVKIKTNGGSMIQMANYGLTKEEADAKDNNIKWSPLVKLGNTVQPYSYVKNEDGTPKVNIFGKKIIIPEQVLLSGSFIAKYIPDYETKSPEELFGTLNPETGKLEGGLIDNRILENIIGYRIPNQGPSSNGAMQIVGILPPGNGDTVVAFAGITKKTGSDFD